MPIYCIYLCVLFSVCLSFALFLVEIVTVLYSYWITLTRSRCPSPSFTGNENIGVQFP